MSIQGKTIVFTGKISKPRHEFQRMVEQHGGIAGSDVSKGTDYLVVGEKPGSKLFRAGMLGIQTLSEEEFMKLLEDKPEGGPTNIYEPNPCGTGNSISHFWFRRRVKDNGDIEENCLCGTTKITHPDGTWEKHEPREVIERAKKIAHQHAVEEERLCYAQQEEAERKEKEIFEFIESLTPEQREELRRQCELPIES